MAYQNNKIEKLPVKIKNKKQKNLYLEYLYITHKNTTYLTKRVKKGIWQNLYEFPFLEFEKEVTEKEASKCIKKMDCFKNSKIEIVKNSEVQKHILSHRIINGRLWSITLDKKVTNNNWKEVTTHSINKYPMSRLMEIFLEKILLIKK